MEPGHLELYQQINDFEIRIMRLERQVEERRTANQLTLEALEARLAEIEQAHANKVEVYDPHTGALVGTLGGVSVTAADASQGGTAADRPWNHGVPDNEWRALHGMT